MIVQMNFSEYIKHQVIIEFIDVIYFINYIILFQRGMILSIYNPNSGDGRVGGVQPLRQAWTI